MKISLALILAITATPVLAADTLRICSGNPKLRYAKTAVQIAQQLNGMITSDVIVTKGSMENLRKLKVNECDAALIQSDSYFQYSADNPDAQLKFEDVGPIYDENIQFICNRDIGISKFTDLKTHPDIKVAIGPVGSGTATTWYAFSTRVPEYGKVASLPISGDLALTRVIGGRDAQCMMVVSGLNTEFMKSVNELGKGKLVLLPVNDENFLTMRDGLNKPLYEKSEIPSGTYDNLQEGFFSSEVSTISVRAEFILSTQWYADHSDLYSSLSATVLRLGQQQGGIH